MTDREVEGALARSFLAGLPPEVAGGLRAEGQRADYPAGTTACRPGPDLGGADLPVLAAERAELSKPGPELRGFLRSHIHLPGLEWQQVSLEPATDPHLAPFTGALDVKGDGALVLLASPGHTAGPVSLPARRAAGCEAVR